MGRPMRMRVFESPFLLQLVAGPPRDSQIDRGEGGVIGETIMSKITRVFAREILDSRGQPTIEVDLAVDDGSHGRAAVPSGASTGEHEALELRDGDSKRFSGKGVLKAVRNVNEILAPKIKSYEIGRQEALDRLLIDADGTEKKEKLGANAILAVSLAYAKASALSLKIPLYAYLAQLSGQKGRTLPVPMMNILNGGSHADNNVDIQEFMIMPIAFKSYREALRAGSEIFLSLKKVLKERRLSTGIGDEGGFAPNLSSNREALEVINKAIANAGYRPGDQIGLAIDAASSVFFKNGLYELKNEKEPQKNASSLCSYYESLKGDFPLLSIEDGMAEDDWEGWREITTRMGDKLQLVGDDLFVTNVSRLKEGIKKKVCNAILIKLNQIGTVWETLQTIALARENGYATVISHRSGETEDTTIAHLAVGTDSAQIKTGSASRTDRICKYNELLRIEEELGEKAHYPGPTLFSKK